MSDPSDIRQASVSSVPPKNKNTVSLTVNTRLIIKVLAFILIVVVAFWLGILYGQHHSQSNSNNTSSYSNERGDFGGARGGGFGTVTAISSSSITVANSRTGASKTYAITSSTKITNDGQTASVSSIADGDRVIVTPSSTNSSDAASILVNPSFGGGFNNSGSGTTGSGTGSSTPDSATTD